MTMNWILVVDDDEDLLETALLILRESGYPADGAPNGREALALLRSRLASPPKLIVLDLRMPVMSGIEFLHAQRKDAALAAIPVLLVSGEVNLREQALQWGLPYVRKPIEMEELIMAVQALVSP
jgi:CheY-like chemotaxis protein